MKDAPPRWRGVRGRRHPGDGELLLRDLVHSELRGDSGLLETYVLGLIAQENRKIKGFSLKHNVESSKIERYVKRETMIWKKTNKKKGVEG